MEIYHAKTSGLANPGDPTQVGGEDWDDPHVITGPALAHVGTIELTTGGAILSQTFSGITFFKDGTGFYRALANGYSSNGPFTIAQLSTNGAAPKFVYVERADYGGDIYICLTTVDSSGTAVNVSGAHLTVFVSDVF